MKNVLKIGITCIPPIITIISGILIFSLIHIDAQNNINENAMNTTLEKAVKIERKLNKTSKILKADPDFLKELKGVNEPYNDLDNHFRHEICLRLYSEEPAPNRSIEWVMENQKNCAKKFTDDEITKIYNTFKERVCFSAFYLAVEYSKQALKQLWNAHIKFEDIQKELFIWENIKKYWVTLQVFDEKLLIPMGKTMQQISTKINKNHFEISQRIQTSRLSIGVNYSIVFIISIIFCVSETCYLIFVVKRDNDEHSLLILNLMTLSAISCFVMFVILVVFGILHAIEIFPGAYVCDSISTPNLPEFVFETFEGKRLNNVIKKCPSSKKVLKCYQVYINSTKIIESYEIYRNKVEPMLNIDNFTSGDDGYFTYMNEPALCLLNHEIGGIIEKLETFRTMDCMKKETVKKELDSIVEFAKGQNECMQMFRKYKDTTLVNKKARQIIDGKFVEFGEMIRASVETMNSKLRSVDFECENLQITEYQNLNSQICDRYSNYKKMIGPLAYVLMIICCISIFAAHFANSKILEKEEKNRQIEIAEKKKMELAKKGEE
ncbi:unnamed protein product [Caenorhabditis angaria]|uniref:Uncharacterized protein n=1 Tax=Caenorhabditis angaria TaxID=860376 RepID=A0A9P1IFR5_9PELO|nr:unnamed protein product [Caenorhabditis angaria]